MTAQQEREEEREDRAGRDRPEPGESGARTPEPGSGSAPVPPPASRPAVPAPAPAGPAPVSASAAPAPAGPAPAPAPRSGQETDPVAEIDRLGRRMDRAVGGFVDDPRRAVRDADAVLEDTVERLTRLLAERRRELRDSWHAEDGGAAGTEELRIALTRYRDITRHLLTVS